MTIRELADQIKDYESDTFSASGSEITDEEAVATAEQLLDWWNEKNLDGVSIDAALFEVRA